MPAAAHRVSCGQARQFLMDFGAGAIGVPPPGAAARQRVSDFSGLNVGGKLLPTAAFRAEFTFLFQLDSFPLKAFRDGRHCSCFCKYERVDLALRMRVSCCCLRKGIRALCLKRCAFPQPLACKSSFSQFLRSQLFGAEALSRCCSSAGRRKPQPLGQSRELPAARRGDRSSCLGKYPASALVFPCLCEDSRRRSDSLKWMRLSLRCGQPAALHSNPPRLHRVIDLMFERRKLFAQLSDLTLGTQHRRGNVFDFRAKFFGELPSGSRSSPCNTSN